MRPRAGEVITMAPSHRYPLDELKARVHLTDDEIAARVGVTDRTIRRLRDTGLSILQADRYAVACGWHPAAIWPGWDGDRDVDVRSLSDHGC